MAVATAITLAMVDAAFRATDADTLSAYADSFRAGDLVVYPTHGVGTVDRVGPEEIDGRRLNLIQVSFTDNRMTLRVPVVKARVAGLRKLVDPATLAKVIATLEGRPHASRLIWARRAQEYQLKINSGDILALAEVVRDLQTAPGPSGASYSQRNLFELAIDRLAAEYAAVTATDKTAALDRLMQALSQNRKAAIGSAETQQTANSA